MKVCFFAHYSITNSDGATLSMYNIIDEMLRRGIEVVIHIESRKNNERIYKKYNCGKSQRRSRC